MDECERCLPRGDKCPNCVLYRPNYFLQSAIEAKKKLYKQVAKEKLANIILLKGGDAI
jgi:hypothetical protein